MRLVKENPLSSIIFRILPYLLTLAWSITGTVNAIGRTEGSNAVKSLDECVAITLKECDSDGSRFWKFRHELQSVSEGRTRAIKILVGILNDPKSRNGTKCYAAYCLGGMRADDAATI